MPTLNARLKTLIAMMSLAVFAAWLRFYHVSVPSFSVDESSSLFFASYPNWRALFWDNHPPLYHLILKGWIHFVPMTETGARSLSILFSVIGISALVIAGQVSGNFKRGCMAAFLLATSCLSIRYAQETRMYSAMEAMTALQLASLFFLLAHQESLRAKILFGFAAVAGVLTHIFGFIAVLMILPVFGGGRLVRRRRFIVLTAMICFVFIAGFAVFQFDARFLTWQKFAYQIGDHAFSNFVAFVLDFGQKDYAISLLCLTLAAASFFHPDPDQRRYARVFGVGTSMLVALAFFGELSDERRVMIPRYFIFLNVGFVWCLTLGLEVVAQRFSHRRLKTGFAIAACLCFAAFSFRAYDYSKPNWRQLAQIARDHQVDLVMSSRPNGFSVPYYSGLGIPYQQFLYSEKFVTRDLIPLLRTHRHVFIVDDNFSRTQYQIFLLSSLTLSHIAFETFDIADSKGGSVFGVLTYLPPNK